MFSLESTYVNLHLNSFYDYRNFVTLFEATKIKV